MTVKGTVCGTSGSVGILRNQRCHFFGPKIIVPACKARRKLKRHTGATRSRTIGAAGAGAILNPTCAGARCPTHSADRDPAQIGARAERPEYVAGDSLDKIAQKVGSTTDVLKKLNPTVKVLQPKQLVRCRKAKIQTRDNRLATVRQHNHCATLQCG